ncbi:Long-chain-fatty-acid--CoA ligase [Rosistilla ulvae]|uniref:Long-chain-fatty-acid--CoA ligase n=1 Tax=Rosistilla ulvae TaxID=1930277 RepID=A0A517M420_9BACT|nr:AMP-binding protein [Rosistilla ulvae]QDS89617.1 Long-chain-fatty-acid--CoA ligase [Rosistilla ulvae]
MSTAQLPVAPPTPWVDGLTIGQVLRETARQYPDADAFVFCGPDVRVSWSELDREVDLVARALLALGFVPGDHFGVWATNVPEWVLLQFATARIGVVLVNINPSYRAGELKFVLQQADVRGLALIDHYKTTHFQETLLEAAPDLAPSTPGHLHSQTFPRLRWIVEMRGRQPSFGLSWNDLMSGAVSVPQACVDEVAERLDPNRAINIQFTSGTTGHPKGATLSHRNVLLNAFYAGQSQRLGPDDRVCLPVPLYHCFGCVLGTMCCIVHGSAMIFPSECFHAGETLAAIEAQRCTAIYGVPTMFIAQLENPVFSKHDLSSLRTGIMAGSPCPIELMRRVTQDMGASEITIGYGQTEASPLITQTRTDDPIELRVGTVGRTLPGFEAKIVDPDTGAELGDGQQGEFCGRGHGVMIGYYHQPDKTAAAIDRDGWLHTGDLGMRQPNGYYRITGRLNDMIIRGGENIYPREIEERLYEHPAVEDVQIVGVPDHRFGEEILAWIKFKRDQQATETELRDFCRLSLAHFKVPRYWKFVDAFPTTVTGKIQKFKIREQAIEELGLQDEANIETA